MVKAKNENRKKELNELEAAKAPGPTTYNQDDRILHEKLRDQKWAKMTEEREYQKLKKGDWKEILYPSVDAVKPQPARTVIHKEH